MYDKMLFGLGHHAVVCVRSSGDHVAYFHDYYNNIIILIIILLLYSIDSVSRNVRRTSLAPGRCHIIIIIVTTYLNSMYHKRLPRRTRIRRSRVFTDPSVTLFSGLPVIWDKSSKIKSCF